MSRAGWSIRPNPGCHGSRIRRMRLWALRCCRRRRGSGGDRSRSPGRRWWPG
jgi:hypothetical protein